MGYKQSVFKAKSKAEKLCFFYFKIKKLNIFERLYLIEKA